MIGEPSKHINQVMTFTTTHTTTHISHIIHPIRLHLVRKATRSAFDEQVYY